MWRFALELDEIQPAIWSCCCIISSFTIQTEVTACPVPEGASAPTDFGQAWWHGLQRFSELRTALRFSVQPRLVPTSTVSAACGVVK